MCVVACELATLDAGGPAPAAKAYEDLFFPCCFRDVTEIPPRYR